MLKPSTTGYALALTFGVLYILCVVALAVLPDFTLSVFNSWFHATTPFYQPHLVFGPVIYGFITLMVYGLIAGALFGWFLNMFRGRTS